MISSSPRMAGIRACVFDAYGTLFDVHSAVNRHLGLIGADGPMLSEIWRLKQLEYSWVRTLTGAYADFWQLTEQALDFALTRMPSVDRRLRGDLLEAYRNLECYPEVPGVLEIQPEPCGGECVPPLVRIAIEADVQP